MSNEESSQRFILRERFLRVLSQLEGEMVRLETYNGATVKGKARSFDHQFSNIHLDNLETPIGCVPRALVRTSDLVILGANLSKLN